MEITALYLHLPFCRAKCSYCDFNSYAGQDALYADYASALAREIEQAGPAALDTVYLGGGTPSVLPFPLIARILAAVNRSFVVQPEAEITMEANPGTVDRAFLSQLRGLGINRLSLGVQSLDAEELRLLGRIHSAQDALDAFRSARQAGFDNINLDLIFGLPGQRPATWQSNLEHALALEPDHLSLYALSVESGTPLARAIGSGALAAPDPDRAADLYEAARERLESDGFAHYEISNWARDGQYACRHNLTYWRNQPYLGLGAGAHSWAGGWRRSNVALPQEYVERMQTGRSPVASQEAISLTLEMTETMMMGLRLVQEGVSFERFRQRFGLSLRHRYGDPLADLRAWDLIEMDEERVRLTRRGQLLGNQVFLRFLPDEPQQAAA